MGEVQEPRPVKLICGVLAAAPDVLGQVRGELAAAFGAIDVESAVIPFGFTSYYEGEMGPALLRQFVAFRSLVDPGRLAEVKLVTNAIEQRFTVDRGGRRARAANLDPGYLTPAKLVLATTKDSGHRVYLGLGIYAEATLGYHHGTWHAHPWTYPDYASGAYDGFLANARAALMDTHRRCSGAGARAAD
jgi:hypothetical protein